MHFLWISVKWTGEWEIKENSEKGVLWIFVELV